MELEIPVSFRSIRSKGLRQLAVGIHPFVIPDRAYSEELGLLSDRMGSGYRKEIGLSADLFVYTKCEINQEGLLK